MGMKEIKAAIIGTGSAARFHLHAYRKCSHIQVTAVCGSNLDRAHAFGKEFGVRAYISIEEMLQKERPDAVTVATLEWDHERPVLLSLQAGCHVLCEKIMAHTIAIGENMVAAAQRAGALPRHQAYLSVGAPGRSLAFFLGRPRGSARGDRGRSESAPARHAPC